MMDDPKLLNKAGEAKETTAGMEEGKIREDESRPELDSDSDSEDDQDSEGGRKRRDDSSGGGDTLTRLRREKRLAMNRESARARRKRKKSHIETLEQQNTGLMRNNDKLRSENQQLILNVESLTQRLANQEKEILVLRSMTGSRSTNPNQLSLQQSAGTHHMSPPLGSTARGASMLPQLPATTAQSLGLDPGDSSAQTSLRRLLHAQGIPQSPYGGGLLGGLPQGGGLPAGSAVSPNYAVDQQILSRIGAEQQGMGGLYDQLLAARSMQAGNALPGRNSLMVPSNEATGLSPSYRSLMPSQLPLSVGSESSRGGMMNEASRQLSSGNDPAAALLLEQLLQRRRMQDEARFFRR